jgi:hypothetical protein
MVEIAFPIVTPAPGASMEKGTVRASMLVMPSCSSCMPEIVIAFEIRIAAGGSPATASGTVGGPSKEKCPAQMAFPSWSADGTRPVAAGTHSRINLLLKERR